MRLWKVAILMLAAATLSGCAKGFAWPDGGNASSRRGPYGAVGLYSPSRQWTRLAGVQASRDPKVAKLVDDQVIIVVQNTATGEVRACGDLTGYCIGMNPWKTALVTDQIAPLRLSEHQKPPPSDDNTVNAAAGSAPGEKRN
jgi:hypothetical protein